MQMRTSDQKNHQKNSCTAIGRYFCVKFNLILIFIIIFCVFSLRLPESCMKSAHFKRTTTRKKCVLAVNKINTTSYTLCVPHLHPHSYAFHVNNFHRHCSLVRSLLAATSFCFGFFFVLNHH